MKIDALVSAANLRDVQRIAPMFEQAGFDVITRTLPAFQEMLLLEATSRSGSYS